MVVLNRMEQCVKKICGKKYLKKQEAFVNKMFDELSKFSKNKNYTLKLKKNYMKKIKETFKKNRKTTIEQCKRAYCNPECKGTIFEKGKSAPKELFERDTFKKGPYKDIAKMFILNQRKQHNGSVSQWKPSAWPHSPTMVPMILIK